MNIKEIILKHKLEKEKLLKEKFIPREKAASIDEKYLKSNLIKVITGPRRSGKSVFCLLLLKNTSFVYLNFDDENLLKISSDEDLLDGIVELYPKTMIFLFDEIQNRINWELFVNKLHRRGFNLILTGSNARLLSKELSTHLTGRYISTEILPFSFREFISATSSHSNSNHADKLYKDYLINGGYPEIVTKKLEVKPYLATLFDSIIFKDAVKRYKVKYSQKFYDLAIYLISNICSKYSLNRLENILDFRSPNTVASYLRYLEETYLFFSLNRFSYKLKEQFRSPKKIFTVDNGFVSSSSFQLSPDWGKLAENQVFVEIYRKGYKHNKDFFYYQTKNRKEVDFVLKKGFHANELIQVCFNTDNKYTRDREIKALIEASNELECDNLSILTDDREKEEEYKGRLIKFIPLWKWLLEKE